MTEFIKFKTIFLLILVCYSCTNKIETSKIEDLVDKIPKDIPMEFTLVSIPENKIVHKGIFSPDSKAYYYTISDQNFENFDVYVIKYFKNAWSQPEKAFFNSQYNDHGMSFSSDGKTVYFSSTRPVNRNDVSKTWHIWKADKIDNKWSVPVFVDVPNLRDKLVSHPTITNSGTLYFHSSNLDYSEMEIYRSKKVNDEFQNAEKLSFPTISNLSKCTPIIAPSEDYLVFATVGSQLDLMISYKDENNLWKQPQKLNSQINTFGQGNPYITPDEKHLFFTTAENNNWKVNWVNITSELKILSNTKN